MNSIVTLYQRIGLVPLIIIGLVLGILIGWLAPSAGIALGLLGTLFVGALKAVAPILVFALVIAAVSSHRQGSEVYVKPVLIMYIFGGFNGSDRQLFVSHRIGVGQQYRRTNPARQPQRSPHYLVNEFGGKSGQCYC